jgi:hypothetical protein
VAPVIRTHRPENRLAKALALPGGITVGLALSQAEKALDALRPDCLSALDAKIAQIDASASGASFSSTESDIEAVYTLSNEILHEAGMFGLAELSEVARSLCNLTDSLRQTATLDLQAIEVHIATMKLLRRPDVDSDPPTRAAVLDGLKQISVKAASGKA